jgi:hypothetical protein
MISLTSLEFSNISVIDLTSGIIVSAFPQCEGLICDQSVHSLDGANQENLPLFEPLNRTNPGIIYVIAGLLVSLLNKPLTLG